MQSNTYDSQSAGQAPALALASCSALTYAQDAADLLARWRNGEDVQDALAHKLRHYVAGCATMRRQLDWLRENCRVVYYFPDDRYPLEHAPHANKDMWDAIIAESAPNVKDEPRPQPARRVRQRDVRSIHHQRKHAA